MNILVLCRNGKVIARPDTTIDKENGDIYAPEDVVAMGFCPAVFARISKAGKMIRKDFVDRYYDSIAFGVNIYPSCVEGKYCRATASCFDHSTLLPYPLFGKITLEAEDNSFELKKNGKEIFGVNCSGIKEAVENAIVKCSGHSSLRIGDFVAVELDDLRDLLLKDEGDCSLEGSFCENKNIDIRINY